jgi:hypothetical protein
VERAVAASTPPPRFRGNAAAHASATEVARRTGHGVAVLLKVYVHCIDGQADAANRRLETRMRWSAV